MSDVLIEPNFESFRAAARSLLAREVEPARVRFVERGAAQVGLFGAQPVAPTSAPLRLPRAYVELAEKVACTGEWELLYRVAFRLLHGEPDLLEIPLDRDTARLRDLARAVMHEVHHLHAFVRFRPYEGRMFAFIAPERRVLRLALPFFVKRFGEEPFVLATPEETAEWDGTMLHFGAGIPRDPAPADLEMEGLFKDYYGAVFDPARANRRLVDQKMPARFRAGMPEVENLDALLRGAGERVATMVDRSVDMSNIPTSRSLPILRESARTCRGCEICEMATQTVFGEGPVDARAMLVGEQPGDREDLEGRPFVGPAGQLLDETLRAIGVDRSALYVTNAVKHFKWEPRGEQRLHRSPKPNEIVACRPWLEAEIEAISPNTIVALGAVAAKSFFGPAFRLHKARGRLFETRWCKRMLVTHHPAAILRAADRQVQRDMRVELEADLALALHGR